MNENKRMLIFFISVILIVAGILVIALWPKADKTFACGVKASGDYKKLGSVNFEQYKCLIKQDGKIAIVISDGLSDDEKKSLNDVAEKTGQGIYYLNDEVSNTNLKKIKKDLKTDKVSYDKPSLVIIENGKVTAATDKNLDSSDDTYDFLQDAGFFKFACNTTSDSEYKNLSRLTYEQYNCLYESGKPFVMVLTQSTCHYCEQFLPVINEYAGENNLPIYFLEIDTMDSEDLQTVFSSLSYFNENSDWGTPLTLGIKDKEVVTELNGYTNEKESIENLFTELGLK